MNTPVLFRCRSRRPSATSPSSRSIGRTRICAEGRSKTSRAMATIARLRRLIFMEPRLRRFRGRLSGSNNLLIIRFVLGDHALGTEMPAYTLETRLCKLGVAGRIGEQRQGRRGHAFDVVGLT